MRRDRPRKLPHHRSPIALHAALLQQPATPWVAVTLWERRVRRDQPRNPLQHRSSIALHAALLQLPTPPLLAASLQERRVRRDGPRKPPHPASRCKQRLRVSGSAARQRAMPDVAAEERILQCDRGQRRVGALARLHDVGAQRAGSEDPAAA